MAIKNQIPVYRKAAKINIGIIIFVIIFVYICFFLYTYLSKKAVFFYEVNEGSLVDSREYFGIIMREESVQTAPVAGYINYYTREGKKIAVGNNISFIDESGDVKQYLSDNSFFKVNLSDKNLREIKKDLSAFSLKYNDSEFYSIYDLKYNVSSHIIELTNFDTLSNMDDFLKLDSSRYPIQTASDSGILSFHIDGFSTKTPSDIRDNDFDSTQYISQFVKSGELVEKDAPIFKIITSDIWSVIFQIDEEDLTKFADKTSLRIKFRGKDLMLKGDFSTFISSEGKEYGKLVFDKYMIQFENSRFVNFDIEFEDSVGLKIPRSSVIEKSFYSIPITYLAKGSNSLSDGFLKESPDTREVTHTPVDIFYMDDNYCYIAVSEDTPLKEGDYIYPPRSSGYDDGMDLEKKSVEESSVIERTDMEDTAKKSDLSSFPTDKYRIGDKASLQGVYNINKGFAIFRHIEILNENEEYYIVKKNTKYGLSVYDHILIDIKGINEGDFIYN